MQEPNFCLKLAVCPSVGTWDTRHRLRSRLFNIWSDWSGNSLAYNFNGGAIPFRMILHIFLVGINDLEESNFYLKSAVCPLWDVSTMEHKTHRLCTHSFDIWSHNSLVYDLYGRMIPSQLTLDIFWREWENWKSLISV
jgi:hypothetical protein